MSRMRTFLAATLIAFAFPFLSLFSPQVHAASCSPNVTLTSVGASQSFNISGCSTFLQPVPSDTSNPRWSGLATALNTQMRGLPRCGVGTASDGVGGCTAQVRTITTSNASYDISGELYNGDFNVVLRSVNSGVTTDTIPLYTYVGDPSATTALTRSNTAYSIEVNFTASATIGITSIAPNTGPAAGGTTTVITGTNLSGVTSVRFGPSPASSFTINSATQITAIAPSGAVGNVDLIASDGTSTSTLSNGYRYTASTDADLVNLTPSAGTLAPAFASGTLSYSVSVPNTQSSITLTPTGDGLGTIQINGAVVASGAASSAISLAVGTNTITVVSTAQDGSTTKTYTVVVTRAASADATLSNLVPSQGTLTPAFAPSTTSYSITVGSAVTSITLTPTATISSSTIDVAGQPVVSGSASGAITLQTGTTVIPVQVTAADGSTLKTYNVSVIRAQDSDATLSNLGVSSGSMSPSFTPSQRNYSVSVPYSVSSIVVTPTMSSPGVLTVNGSSVPSGSPSGSIPLNVGSNAITVVTTANDGTMLTYSVSVERAAATITATPSSGALPSGVRGQSYNQAIVGSGGSGPYTYVLAGGALPAGVTLSSLGVISGAPTTAGTYSFTLRVTDTLGSNGIFAYSLTVGSSSALAMSPAAGAIKSASTDVAYEQLISSTGATGTVSYRLSAGALPAGLSLNSSSGLINGTPAADSTGNYTFTIEASDTSGSSTATAYTLAVSQSKATAANQSVSVSPGETPGDVLLTQGATGGPFTAATLIEVQPSNAGTAQVVKVASAAGTRLRAVAGDQFYLRFQPSAAFSGIASVSYTLTSAQGTSNTAVVSYSVELDRSAVASQIDRLVHNYVQNRQNLISSSIKIPGLLERRQLQNGGEAISTTGLPGPNDLTMGFSTSLAQLDAARANPNDATPYVASKFDAWASGTYLRHGSDNHGGQKGNFGLISAGMSVLLTQKDLIGWSFHYDRMTDPTDEDADLTGNGWLTGPYYSSEIGKGVFFDTSLLFGGSSNDIQTEFFKGNFDTKRWLFDTRLSGIWNLSPTTDLTPELRAIYLDEKVNDYSVSNSIGEQVDLKGFSETQMRVSVGGKLQHRMMLSKDLMLVPNLGAKVGVSGMGYGSTFTTVSAGLGVMGSSNWNVDTGLLMNVDNQGQRSVGASASLNLRF